MPDLDHIRSTVADLSNGPPLVVAITGGTTGIGSYVAHALASGFSKDGSKLRVYIVGRNVARAEAVMAEGQRLSPGSDWRFVRASDLALMGDVDAASAEIARQENEAPFCGGPPRLDLLYMSHCYPILKARSTTKEGLDSFLSTTYYSRIRFIQTLTPLLSASSPNQRRHGRSHVISIYAGNMEDATPASPNPDDLPLGLPSPATYNLNTVRKNTCFMKTFLFESLADTHAGKIAFSHIYPGLVDGPGFYSADMPLWFRVVWKWFVRPVARWVYMTKPEDCGRVMVYLGVERGRYPAKGGDEDGVLRRSSGKGDGEEAVRSTKGEGGGGSYALGQRAEGAGEVAFAKLRREGLHEIVWEHTMGVFEQIDEKGRVAS